VPQEGHKVGWPAMLCYAVQTRACSGAAAGPGCLAPAESACWAGRFIATQVKANVLGMLPELLYNAVEPHACPWLANDPPHLQVMLAAVMVTHQLGPADRTM